MYMLYADVKSVSSMYALRNVYICLYRVCL